jgi:hypothetical protein
LLNLKIELRFFVSIEKFSTREKFTIFIFWFSTFDIR